MLKLKFLIKSIIKTNKVLQQTSVKNNKKKKWLFLSQNLFNLLKNELKCEKSKL